MMFKLYLYGIEIALYNNNLHALTSSNCTFMELKLVKEHILKKELKFKLYLYGIEMKCLQSLRILMISSNCTFMELKSN